MKPTNILFINSDQHSKRVLGCYGNPVVKTPNLDALAARGTRFANAYCPTPICVPSRASLATGRYAHKIESWDNARPYIGTEAPSWGHRLTEQGHKVTTIGKLHYRKVGDPTGFADQRLPMHVLDGVGDLYQLLRSDMPVRPNSRRQVLEAGPSEVEYTRYDRAIGEHAVRWIMEEGVREDKPWALFVSFVYPHFPLGVPEEYFNRYPPESRAMAVYYGMVTYLDERIGDVLRALEDSGQAENTRIIYATDHGEQLAEHGLWWKSSMYEGSVGIPLIVAGPEIPAGKVSNTN